MSIKNFNPLMNYRRFGKTEKELSVITLGGMRYKHGWDQPRDDIPGDMREQCAQMVTMALDAGINHIETAHGYMKSEHCYGLTLNDDLGIPRDRYHLMTKGSADSASEMRKLVEGQLRALKTDHIDLYGFHGINNATISKVALAKKGPVEELLKMKAEGIIGDVGFSTHAPLHVIIDAIASELFSFVNLHYYYFFQRNAGAVAYAAAKDLGVFIISPNDKGGQLFKPSPLVRQLTAPMTPIQWNARWCLRTPHVQTLSFGLTEPAHIKEMTDIMPASVPLSAQDAQIAARMDARAAFDPTTAYEGYELVDDPSGINIPEVLRYRRLWKCWDMENFGHYRYNMFEAKGHWFPGIFATDDAIKKMDRSKWPAGVDVEVMIREAHQRFYKAK